MNSLENDSDNEDWQQMQNDWQSYQPDIKKIKRRILWVTWRMIAILVLDVLILVTYIPFLIFWVIPANEALMIKIWHYAMFPLLIYGVFLDFKLRMPLLRIEGESTKGILGLYLERVKAGVKLGIWGFRFCFMLLVLFLTWIGVTLIVEPEIVLAHKLKNIIFGLVWIGLFAGGSYWYKNRKQEEEIRLTSLWKEYLE